MAKRKTNLIALISIFMFFLLAVTGMNLMGLSKTTYAESAQTNENFYLSVFDRDSNILITQEEETFNGKKAYIYQWSDTNKFVLNIDASKKIPTKSYKQGVETYDLTIEVEYLQGYYQKVAWTNYNTLLLFSNTQQGENSYLNFASLHPELNIDQGIEGADLASGAQVKISSWGIYRFRMVINGQDTYSDYFVVKPTLEVLEAPKISYRTTPSQVSLHSAYKFSLKNENKYKYIDKSKLVWYALGTAEDGTTYALTYKDISSGKKDFKNCSTALYETWERTGQSFYFDDKGVAGEWKIWCEYNYDGDDATTLKSNVEKIKSGQKIKPYVTALIIIGVAFVSIGITIGICVYKNKRERIY